MAPKPRPNIGLVRPLDYFTYNERKSTPEIVQFDLIEWDVPDPESTFIVEESRNCFKVNAVRRAWERLTGKKS